ncbi:uncharacterized protein [Phaseolus vulgaris]|uniref:uncharacterized protein n=1 Tax=Phaseolus vulgaris TaxID=3885 RepID=UPI0035CAB3A2
MSVEAQRAYDAFDVELVFTKADLRDVVPHDNDAVVISVVTVGRKVHRVLVDQGSSADVMFWTTFNKLQLSPDMLRPYTGCLYGFTGDQVEVRGHLELRTTFTNGTASRTDNIRYLFVNVPSAYNILLGRHTLNRLGAVSSKKNMKMKLPDLGGKVITIKSNQKEAKRCYENNLKTKRWVFIVTTRAPHAGEIAREGRAQRGVPTVTTREPSEERDAKAEITRAEIARERRPESAGDVWERDIGGKVFKLGSALNQTAQDQIAKVIARHLDAFTWSASDMSGIDPDFLCHHLTMDPKVRLVRQRRRKFNEERRQVIREETQKLLSAGHIREIQYPGWLANVVLVQKANEKWRMCVDFTDLNKVCPKNFYPLSSIDVLVYSTSGCNMLNFLDAFSGITRLRCIPGTNARQQS